MKHERYSLETNGQDRFNRLARYGTSDVKIQAVLRACGHLDSRRLERSLHLLLRREPVLTCRFVEESPRSHFEPIGAEEQPRWYRYQATEDVESAADHFLSEPIGLTGDQQIELLHLRGEEGDTVCVRLNHACCDGGGAKPCLRSLAQIYTELGEGGGDPASASGGLRDSGAAVRGSRDRRLLHSYAKYARSGLYARHVDLSRDANLVCKSFGGGAVRCRD